MTGDIRDAMIKVFDWIHEFTKLLLDELMSRHQRDASVWDAMALMFSEDYLTEDHPTQEQLRDLRKACKTVAEHFHTTLEELVGEHQSLRQACIGNKEKLSKVLKRYLAKNYQDGGVAYIVKILAHYLLGVGSNAMVERDVKVINDVTTFKHKNRSTEAHIEDMVIIKCHLNSLDVKDELQYNKKGEVEKIGPFLTELYKQWEDLRKRGSLLTKNITAPS